MEHHHNHEKGLGRSEIIEARDLAPSIRMLKIHVPLLVQSSKPGQFVVLRIDERGERIPLTITDTDSATGLMTIVFQSVGSSTQRLALLGEGDFIADVVGPLGIPSEIERFGHVVCIGGGVGIAPVYPIMKALKEAGNEITCIVGARSKEILILQQEVEKVADRTIYTTDDGTYGTKGFVTDALSRLISGGVKIDRVIAIGPVIMMRAVSKVTKQHNIPTIVSLNSIMVDATGMCGACRVSVGGKTRFVCVNGPEFDAHQVDFDELLSRQAMYNREEYRALWHYKCAEAEEKGVIEVPKNRVPMPHQDPRIRIQNFDEVALGYTRGMAMQEASRCLNCKKHPCVSGCPVNIDIPGFVSHIKTGDFLKAIKSIKEANSLPAICGRVCPQETQCEAQCVLGKKGKPIAIGRLERFVADYETAQGEIRVEKPKELSGKKVAIIGSGPAGLTAAAVLAKMGHQVTLFEALHKTGGVLIYGIPEFRLPKRIVQTEVDYVRKLGVEIQTSFVVGKLKTIDYFLNNGFDAVFLATGAGLPYMMNIPGENLNGVYTANEFLTRNNLMKAYLFPEYDTPIRIGRHMAVIGGGNVAMDSARVALRLGAEKVSLVYRRSREEMPARAEEVENALEEGIELVTLAAPVRILGDEKGWVRGMECQRMELGEPDASGRRRPVPIPGSEFIIDVDVIVVAIGQSPNLLAISDAPDIRTDKKGRIISDPSTGKTSKPGVFAGGDAVTGAATVIEAMGAGKRAAKAIDEYLKTGE
ncbi:MAG: NADPH-dependent glutamate synthase [bacterium]